MISEHHSHIPHHVGGTRDQIVEEFIENTQNYEAESVKEQIEFLRQKKYDPVSTMYLYYWSDACPMIGSA